MSLLPTEHLSIVLCPDQVGIVRSIGRFRRQQHGQIELLALADNNTSWKQSLEALAYWLETEEIQGMSATVTISDAWMRFALAPWSVAVGNEVEENSLARACLEAVYGDLTGWILRMGPSRYGDSRIVCAIEAAFLDRLRAVLSEHKITCNSIHPYFMLAVQQAQSLHTAPASLLAVAESGTVVLASAQRDRWHSLRSVRCGVPSETLTQLLQREILLQGFAEAPVLGAVVPGIAQAKIPEVPLLGPHENTSSPVRAMVLEAANSTAEIGVNFAPKIFHRGRIIGLFIFAAAIGIAGCSGWSYLQLRQKADIWQADSQRLRHNEGQSHTAGTPENQERVKAELRFANRVIEKLDTPWDVLFGGIEESYNKEVTLLSVEPDTERREVRLVAESKDLKGMLDYVQKIRQSQVLKNSYLIEHQINQQDPQHPVRFTITATWASPTSIGLTQKNSHGGKP